MLHLDLTHCSHSPAQTGIQQVARGLWRELGDTGRARPLVYDKYGRRWRGLDAREREHLATVDQRDGVRRKRPHWSTWQRLRGRLQHQFGRRWISPVPPLDRLLVPEFFDDFVREELPRLRLVLRGPDVAVFHDAIAFHEPAWGVPGTTARYPAYLRSLAPFRGIAAVSDFSRRQLEEAWARLGVSSKAELATIPLGLRDDLLGPRPSSARRASPERPVRVLCVSTLEPRKNHAALLDAAEALWQQGHRFELLLIGLHNRGFPPSVPRRIDALRERGRPLTWEGAVSARRLRAAYAEADLSVYPSHCEGFGLPVWESLWHGTPCVTGTGGALSEIAPGGGSVNVPSADAESLAATLATLLKHPDRRTALAAEALARPLRTMRDYAADLLEFVESL